MFSATVLRPVYIRIWRISHTSWRRVSAVFVCCQAVAARVIPLLQLVWSYVWISGNVDFQSKRNGGELVAEVFKAHGTVAV